MSTFVEKYPFYYGIICGCYFVRFTKNSLLVQRLFTKHAVQNKKVLFTTLLFHLFKNLV